MMFLKLFKIIFSLEKVRLLDINNEKHIKIHFDIFLNEYINKKLLYCVLLSIVAILKF